VGSNSFRTELNIGRFPFSVSYSDSFFLIGSCFSENIGQKLIEHKFNSCVNPFGIIYNPVSIENALNRIVAKKLFSEDELLYVNNKYLSLEHHGKFSGGNKEDVLRKINMHISESYSFLKKSSHVFITPGTAWVHEYKKLNKTVANCHKISGKEFYRKLLSAEQIFQSLCAINEALKKINPEIKIFYTVSPVRHLRDGFVENQHSKSLLHAAVQEVINDKENVFYFPSYEIMIDDLRDYRFYAEDMIHPSAQAIDYIWDKMIHSLCEPSVVETINEVNRIVKSVRHKPIHSNSEEHKNFANSLLHRLNDFSHKNPQIDFSSEINLLTNYLK
jgi:hypothetical protein